MTVNKYKPPTQSSDTFPEYKDNIDGSIRVLAEIAANFAPRESDTPAMTVTVEAGKLWDSETATYIAQALQTSTTITAPVTNPRIDRIAINTTTGAFVIIAGSEAASPVAPAYTSGQYPVCQIALIVSQTAILNSDLTDERPLINLEGGGVAGIVSTADATAMTIDSSENIGIGVTPEAWHADWSAIQIGANAALMSQTTEQADNAFFMSQNAYYDGAWKYQSTDEASTYYQNGGVHTFSVAPSGTANATAAFTTALTLDNSANATFGGNISLGDNKYLYLGDGNDLGIRHNGSNAYVENITGGLVLWVQANSQVVSIETYNSVGINKRCALFGGAIPKAGLYYDATEQISTASGGPTLNATPTAGDNSTKIATTAYVDSANAFRGCLVYSSANQTLTNTVAANLLFASEQYDTDAIHNTSTNTDRLVVPAGVTKVKINYGVTFAGNATSTRRIALQKNGSTFTGSGGFNWSAPTTSNTWLRSYQSPVLSVSATDYFDLEALQNSGGDLDVVASGTWFAMEIIE